MLRQYLTGVLDRASQHARGVDQIALAVAGAVVWRKDPNAPITVMELDGEMKNVLWVTIGGKKCAISHNHHKDSIEVRANSTQGSVVAAFTNATPVADLKKVFESL